MKTLMILLTILVCALPLYAEEAYLPDEKEKHIEEIQKEEEQLREESTLSADELQKELEARKHIDPQIRNENFDSKEGSVD